MHFFAGCASHQPQAGGSTAAVFDGHVLPDTGTYDVVPVPGVPVRYDPVLCAYVSLVAENFLTPEQPAAAGQAVMNSLPLVQYYVPVRT